MDPQRTLIHETWGDHAALLARTRTGVDGSVGTVTPRAMQIASEADPLRLQYGTALAPVTLGFETYGELNPAGDNAILVCHALTGSAHAAGFLDGEEVPGWWDPLIGPGKPVDTNRFFVVSSNVLGGCYGSTGPTTPNPASGTPYAVDFPRYTIRDMVSAQARLLERLGVRSLASVIGGSMGGMQVLEWAAMFPERIRSMIPIAIGPRHSAWAIGLNEVARRAITSDVAWRDGRYEAQHQPERGLGLARAIAMLSYRSFDSLEHKFGRERSNASNDRLGASFEIESYLDYQGVKLVQRFDANTYLWLTKAMDDYDLADGRERLSLVLRRMSMPALVMGIGSDVLYPEAEQKSLAEALPNADYVSIRSPHGHDAFLIEFPQLAAHIRKFLERVR